MDPPIECCVANIDQFWESLPETANLGFHEQSCLEHCGTCWRRPFVVRDGELLESGTYEDLRESVAPSGSEP